MSTSRKVVDPSFDKSHCISIESVGHLGTEDGNTRLDTTQTKQTVIEKYGCLNNEIAVNSERLKLISKECPDMWIICDVQLIDPNAADYFTELDSMQRKEGGELEKKQDAFKHLHEHLILELVYFDKSNMIMYFGWCNHEDVISKVSYNMHELLPHEYQRYWLLIKTKWGKICIPVYLLVLRQGIAPTHPQRDGAEIECAEKVIYHGRYTLDATLQLMKKKKNTAASLSATLSLSGIKRKISTQKSFDTRIHDLVAYKRANGHCDVPTTGEYASLGRWCIVLLKVSRKQIQNKGKPKMKLSPEQIQRLTEVGFKWPHQGSFDDRFNELVAYKRANGHCDVHTTGKDVSLGGDGVVE
jgi:hypothetical protein